MSVIVKGIEMPNACCHCPCSDSAGCAVTGRAMTTEEMAGQLGDIDNCPLVELPEKHGRLIDAKVLDAAFTDLRFNDDGTLLHWGDRKNWCLHGSGVESLIDNAETVLEAEGD